MDNEDFIPVILMQRIKDLRKLGYQVIYEPNEEGLFTLQIKKAKTKEKSKHYFFYF